MQLEEVIKYAKLIGFNLVVNQPNWNYLGKNFMIELHGSPCVVKGPPTIMQPDLPKTKKLKKKRRI